jgi:hypothetical protein
MVTGRMFVAKKQAKAAFCPDYPYILCTSGARFAQKEGSGYPSKTA